MSERTREALREVVEEYPPGLREELETKYAAVDEAYRRLVSLEESRLGWLQTYRPGRLRDRLRIFIRLYLYRVAARAARGDMERLGGPRRAKG